jgi:hypothetical protein
MKKTLLLSAALLALSASVASAAGINFGWGDCGADPLTANKNFACNSNTLTGGRLVGSFIPPAGTTGISGEEIVIDLQSASSVLPTWWQFKNVGTCRQTAFTVNADFTTGASPTCNDYWVGQASGGFTQFDPNVVVGQTNRARIKVLYAVPPSLAGPVDENLEYGAFNLNISGAKTVGAGACVGCADPVCLVLNEIRLTQAVGLPNYRLQSPALRNYATWQGGAIGVGGCPAVVPAQNRTWGSVKSLYR